VNLRGALPTRAEKLAKEHFMAGRVQGKVALITGGGRGQGRSHALRLAAEGADIIAFDICHDLKSVDYELSTPDDLKETVAQVEELDRRAIGIQGDVRDLSALAGAVSQALGSFGRLDIVCANAGVASFVPGLGMEGWAEVAGTNLVGVMNTLHAALPVMGAGGSAIVTGSFAALMKGGVGSEPGGMAYSYAKRQLIDYVKWIAAAAGPRGIRVNGVHPTNCNTRLLMNDGIYRTFRPDLDNPTREDALPAFATMQLLPGVPYVEPEDISNAVVFLASEEARYITGQFLSVDAGAHLKLLD
jgi:SDR family mycofactocin-dependent oxidoreductase